MREYDILHPQLADLGGIGERQAVHILLVSQLHEPLRARAYLIRPEMGEGQIGKIIAHCAVLEYVDAVLGPQYPLLQGLGGLIPGRQAENAFEALWLALPQALHRLVVERLYVYTHAGRSRGLFSASGAFIRGRDAAALADPHLLRMAAAIASEGKSLLSARPAYPSFDLHMDDACGIGSAVFGRLLDGAGLSSLLAGGEEHMRGRAHQPYVRLLRAAHAGSDAGRGPGTDENAGHLIDRIQCRALLRAL